MDTTTIENRLWQQLDDEKQRCRSCRKGVLCDEHFALTNDVVNVNSQLIDLRFPEA